MKKKNDSLNKFLLFVEEISNQSGNEWFKSELISKLTPSNSLNFTSLRMDEIYEYCLKKILREHAEKFYSDFKLHNIKEKLIEDFIRMETFRRDDNFEDFCLALFQQIEGIVNALITNEIQSFIFNEKDIETCKIKDKSSGLQKTQKLWQLIFNPDLKQKDLELKLSKPIIEWEFSERFKVVLYYYYFKKKIYNYYDFQNIFFIGYELYQSRNLNHRGGHLTDKQQKTIEKVQGNSHKYYFKFLGFLEDFISKINFNISCEENN